MKTLCCLCVFFLLSCKEINIQNEIDMVFTSENILLIGSVLVFISILLTRSGFRFGIPVLLLFLGVGMLFGSDGLGVQFYSASDAQFIGMIALCLILFSGGMDTRIQEIRPVLLPGISLSTVGVLLTTLFTGLFIYYISGYTRADIHLSLVVSFLLAATMSSTDSASVFNLLRSKNMNLKENLRPLLELESGSNDPMAYMLTVVLIQVATLSSASAGDILKDFFLQFFLGALIGFLVGRFAVWLLQRIDLVNSALYSILILSLVFFLFTVTDLIHGNAYLAVYVAGIVLGNSKIPYRKEVGNFVDGLTWFGQIVLFLTLGLLVNPHELWQVADVALLIALFMMLLGRPLSVLLSLLPFRKFSFRSRIFVSWVGLRGAVPIIFATYPVIAGVEGAGQIFNIVFFITLLSLLLQGMTLSPLASRLSLSAPMEPPRSFYGIEIPEETQTRLTEVLLTADMLSQGNRLADLNLPQGHLVIFVKRGQEYLVPNGRLQLQEDDHLLIISEQQK